MTSFRKEKYGAYRVDLGMFKFGSLLATCTNNHEKFQYGSCRKVMSIDESSFNMFADGSIKSLTTLELPS
jgi:hypothetical protein